MFRSAAWVAGRSHTNGARWSPISGSSTPQTRGHSASIFNSQVLPERGEPKIQRRRRSALPLPSTVGNSKSRRVPLAQVERRRRGRPDASGGGLLEVAERDLVGVAREREPAARELRRHLGLVVVDVL